MTLTLLLGLLLVQTPELPKTVASAACDAAPIIDGTIADVEWKNAAPVTFTMKFIGINPASESTRVCTARFMNSANALYIALQVPDETLSRSLDPLEIDFAMALFARGRTLARGDDRKGIGPDGLYVDKHVTTPGKDADDPRKDGEGVSAYKDGSFSFEWSVPLNSDDANDLQARPGDAVRFNLAYIDAFCADLRNTKIGGAYGSLDDASGWGTLQLAGGVKDDGARSSLGRRLGGTKRLKVLSAAGTRAVVEYSCVGPTGAERTAKGKIYVPSGLQTDSSATAPLYYAAGYELDDGSAAGFVHRGWVVVTPHQLEANPLVRTPNCDAALLHIARSLPFVDDARVMIGGGSAGGTMTLMLAAETFPLAGAAPDVPSMNLGYNAAFYLKQKSRLDSTTPAAAGIVPIMEQLAKVYGENTDDKTWYHHSPLSHLSTITCPVSVVWTTADMLVPFPQIGDKWVKPFDPKAFPSDFTMDRLKLGVTQECRMRLTDVLPKESYEVFVQTPPEGAVRRGQPGGMKAVELSVSITKPWSIVILDEGAPEPQVDHLKHVLRPTREKFYGQVLTGKIPVSQLTPAKLERLMDRYAGKEWLPSGGLRHLDFPEAEKADVLRGLKTFVSSGLEHARHFFVLYDKLPAARKALDPAALKELR